MKPAAPKATRRRIATAGLVAAALLGATGCSFIKPQATTEVYAPSDGIIANVGDAELRNLLLVSKAHSTAGRYLGSVFNETREPLGVVITIEGTATRLTVPGGRNPDTIEHLYSTPAALEDGEH